MKYGISVVLCSGLTV